MRPTVSETYLWIQNLSIAFVFFGDGLIIYNVIMKYISAYAKKPITLGEIPVCDRLDELGTPCLDHVCCPVMPIFTIHKVMMVMYFLPVRLPYEATDGLPHA